MILLNQLDIQSIMDVLCVKLPVLTCLDRLGSLLFFRIYLIRIIVILATRVILIKVDQFGPTIAAI